MLSCHGLRQLTRNVEHDVRTVNFRSDVIFALLQKHRMTFGKGHYATINAKNKEFIVQVLFRELSLIKLHTNVNYDNIWDKLAFQPCTSKIKVTVAYGGGIRHL